MTEERYQYLKSLSIEEYDKVVSLNEQDEYCRIAYERGESKYVQCFTP